MAPTAATFTTMESPTHRTAWKAGICLSSGTRSNAQCLWISVPRRLHFGAAAMLCVLCACDSKDSPAPPDDRSPERAFRQTNLAGPPVVLDRVRTTPELPSQSLTEDQAKAFLSRLHPGMRLGEVRQMVIFQTNNLIMALEHGGLTFDLSLGNGWFVQLRVEHPRHGNGLDDSRINWPPSLDRH